MADEESGIERLRKGLYSRDESRRKRRERRELRESFFDVEEKWPHEEAPHEIMPKRKRSLLPIILAASVIFFVISLAVSVYLFWGGTTAVSAKNVDINISGPVSVSGGEALTLQISIVNRNTVAMESADLIIEYPEGTRSPSDVSVSLPRTRESLGTIAPGGQISTTAQAVLFGKENTVLNISITVEYRTEGSSAIFFKEDEYKVHLAASPLTIAVSSLKEVISGQETEFTVEVTSNSASVIKDVLLEAVYPFGFELTSASPEPSFGTNVWLLGDIPPEETQRVVIRGTLEGQNDEERIVGFRSGIQSKKNKQEIEAAYGSADVTLIIKRPFLSVSLSLNGNVSSEYISGRGEKIRADITWQNNLPTQIFDTEVVVSLNGLILDKSSVSASRGFYNSALNTITWSKETFPEMSAVSPGATGRVSFSFASLSLSSGTSFRNPQMLLDISAKGRRLSETQVPEEIRSTLGRVVKVTTDLLLSSRAVYTVGPFANRGPLPPKAEEETTYTIIWTVTNSSNAVSNAAVVATLPSYVRWLEVMNPGSASITFNPVGRTITWNIGEVAAGLSSSSSAKEVAFQIALTPSLAQVGSSPVLVSQQILSGIDRFTGTNVGSTNNALTTRLSTDPNAASNHASVTN